MKQTKQYHSTHTLAHTIAVKSMTAVSLAFLIFSPCQSMGIQAAGSSSDLPTVCASRFSSASHLGADASALVPAITRTLVLPDSLSRTETSLFHMQLEAPIQKEDTEVTDSLYLSSRSPKLDPVEGTHC